MKKLFLLFLALIFISFVSAVPPVTTVQEYANGYVIVESPQQVLKYNENYLYNMFLYNYSNGKIVNNSTVICDFRLANNTGDVITYGNLSYNSAGYWQYLILGGNFSYIGRYFYGVNCQGGNGGSISGAFEVTLGGQIPENISSNIIILVFFSSMFVGYFYLNKNINYDGWYNKILNRYSNKNYIKVVLSSIGFNIMKNSFVIYYIIGLPIVFILFNIVYVNGITPLIQYADILLYSYLWSSLLIAIFLFSYIQEWIVMLIEDISNMNWGLANEK